MAVKLVTFGLASIEFADILPDGGTGTTFAAIGYTMKDTCKFIQEDPQETPVEVEEADDPIDYMTKAGKKTLSFTLADPDEAALALLMGGIGTTGVTWDAPATFTTIEKSVKVTPTQGLILTIPRGKINAKWNGDYSKSTNLKIDVEITVMTPTKTGVAPFTTTRVS